MNCQFSRSILAFPELQEELKWTSEKQSFNIHILIKDEYELSDSRGQY